MIFVTVGTQLPLPRLTTAVDRWAADNPGARVFTQVGSGEETLEHSEVVESLSATAFKSALASADVVVAHAGVGIALATIDAGKPLIVMPRRMDLGEHRSEHQRRISEVFAQLGATVVHDEDELCAALDARLDLPPMRRPNLTSSAPLVDSLRRFVFAGRN